MPRGTLAGQYLKYLWVFDRPGRSTFSQLTVFIKHDAILPVDQTLEALKEAYPNSSISELVAGAVIAEGARAKRLARRQNRQPAN